MELKYSLCFGLRDYFDSSNRTFMELKCKICINDRVNIKF